MGATGIPWQDAVMQKSVYIYICMYVYVCIYMNVLKLKRELALK